MFYTYVLITQAQPAETYVGSSTSFPDKRVSEHNTGLTPATKQQRPWKLLAYFAFQTHEQALAFEKYLKTGSGRAFLKRWLFSHPPQS